jgi:hypothetical protein
MKSSSSSSSAPRCVYKNEANYQPAGAGASFSARLVLIPSCQQRVALLVRPREGQEEATAAASTQQLAAAAAAAAARTSFALAFGG